MFDPERMKAGKQAREDVTEQGQKIINRTRTLIAALRDCESITEGMTYILSFTLEIVGMVNEYERRSEALLSFYQQPDPGDDDE